nr:transposase, mutator type [Tanacetum cinerariifolium]
VFALLIRIEAKFNSFALTDIGSNINVIPYHIYVKLGREEVKLVNKKITMLDHSKAEPMGILKDVLCQVGVRTILVKFLILDIHVDKDVPIVVRRSFLYTCGGIINTIKGTTSTFDGVCHQKFYVAAVWNKHKSDSDEEDDYCIKRDKNGKPIYDPKFATYLNCDDPMDCALALQEAITRLEKFVKYDALVPNDDSDNSNDSGDDWEAILEGVDFGDVPHLNGINVPPYVCNMGKSSRNKKKPCGNYKMTYSDEEPVDVEESDQVQARRPLSYVDYFGICSSFGVCILMMKSRMMDLKLIFLEPRRLRDDSKEKGVRSQRESMICYGQFIRKIAKRENLLTDEVLDGLSASVYCRPLDTTTLRELIDSNERLISKETAPGDPRVAVPRPTHHFISDLYDRMGRMEIRQDLPRRKYVDGEVTFVDLIDIEQCKCAIIDTLMYQSSGYEHKLFYHYKIPLKGLDIELRSLASDTDIGEMLKYVHKHKIIYVDVEYSKLVLDLEVNVVDLDTQA